MFEYSLPIAVNTLDKKELLPAGTLVHGYQRLGHAKY